jgi:DNA replication and repair protein RecF
MFIRSLKLRNFKSHREVKLDFPERICVITGNNGSGKTNLLDAIHHAGLLRSAFQRQDALNISFNESFYRLDADLEEEGKSYRLTVLCESGKKKQVEWNGKSLERLALHLGKFPLVLILPDDPFQMNEDADWRRSAIDNVLSQSFPEYANHLGRFKKLLSQRNALLRYFSEGRKYDSLLLDALDEEIAPESRQLFELRNKHLPALNEHLREEYSLLSSGKEEASMLYTSQLADIPVEDLLKSRRHRDLEAGRTTAGLQRDDFEYLLNNIGLKKYASQGQQKTFLLALKLAQYRFMTASLGKLPCLLLDDVFDKLDENRISRLIQRICAPGMGQVFLTDAREERCRTLFRGISCQMLSMDFSPDGIPSPLQ